VGLGIGLFPLIFALFAGTLNPSSASDVAIWFTIFVPLGAIVGIVWLVIGLIRNSNR
jgi:hypothetical protein